MWKICLNGESRRPHVSDRTVCRLEATRRVNGHTFSECTRISKLAQAPELPVYCIHLARASFTTSWLVFYIVPFWSTPKTNMLSGPRSLKWLPSAPMSE